MKTKVLFLLHLPPPVHGSSMVGQFIKDSKLINSSLESTFINLLASKNVGNTGKISVTKLWGFVITWFRLLKILINNKPALCYFAITATGAAFFRDVLLIVLLKVFRVKRVYHMHNKGVSKYNNHLFFKLLYKFIFKNAQVILLSNHLYYDIEKFVKKTEVYVCPNGVPEIKNSRSKTVNNIVQLLFLSNLIESKGVYVLLESCKRLDEANINFKCNFIGGQGDISEIDINTKIDEYNLQYKVRYLGRKYGKEKEEYYNNADIFVFPTYYHNETFGLVNLEAMQYSLPVISTFEGGIPDLIKNGVSGFLIPQQNVDILTEKLKYLIENPEIRLKMGQEGRIRYEKEFTLIKFEENLLNILNKIIE